MSSDQTAFVKSGFLYLGPYANDTRWLNFPHDPVDALDHPIHSKTIDYNVPPDAETFAQAAPQYMKMLSENTTELPWVYNRTILFIGEWLLMVLMFEPTCQCSHIGCTSLGQVRRTTGSS